MREDLKLARQRLKLETLTLVVAKEGKVIFKKQTRGISGLLKAIEELHGKMEDSSVANKIVGSARCLTLCPLWSG